MHRTFKLALELPALGVECPFLYQTRTIARHQPSHRQTPPRPVTTTTTSQRSRDTSSQDDGQKPAPRSFLKEKAAQVGTKRKLGLGPSLTSSEQEAFDKIMTLFEKPVHSTTGAHATSVNHRDTDYKNIVELFASMPAGTENSTTATSDKSSHEADTSEAEKQIQPDRTTPRFSPFAEPTKLQAETQVSRDSVTANIQDLPDEPATTPTTIAVPHSSTEKNARDSIEHTTLALVEDASNSLTDALSSINPRPEVAMWHVAEQKIFPLIHLLGSPTTHARSPSEPETTQQDTKGRRPHPLIPPSTPLLPLLTQAYPSLTLLLIRQYASHHPTSPYALALLPTLKSLGPTSYVLGANAHFYNTLLSLQWTVYSSLRGVVGLLEEMEANGVDFDVGTWDVLEGIRVDRERDLDGEGERGAAWWARREQTVWWGRVGGEWIGMVKKRLQDKGLVPGEVMREGRVDGDDPGVGLVDGDSENKEFMVTL